MSWPMPEHFSGEVNARGRLVVDDLPRWIASLAALVGKRVVVDIGTPATRRSIRQNKYWRGFVVPLIAAHEAKKHGRDLPYPNDSMHDLLVRTFWPCIETSLGAMRESTANLTMADMAELTTRVQAHYAQDKPPLNIPSPDDGPWEEVG